MNCPRCQTELAPGPVEVGAEALQVPSCRSCGGHWFEREQLARLEQTVEVVWVELHHLPPTAQQDEPLACPRCSSAEPMDKFKSRRDQAVVMDVCPQCRGVWLDGGEPEAILRENLIRALVDAVRFIAPSR